MSVPRTVAEVIHQHVTLEVEGIDRMYLNVYQPRLQSERGVASFFRYHAKLCTNGHESVKRQLAREGIAFEALDNGVLPCATPKRLQELCDGLPAATIDKPLRKWLARLPHPFTPADRRAGYRYDVS